VFESVVLRRIFGPKSKKVIEEWIKLHNAELQNLYPPTVIIRMIKLRRIRRAGHVARKGEKRNA
jgi:hypothetical protein